MDWISVPPGPEDPVCVFRGASRIFAVGDLHGNYAGFTAILRACGLIGAGNRWMGGDSHLVQLGDVFGRGGEPGRILNLLKSLEAEAAAQGGRVHMLLGNHEILSLRGAVFYNTLEEFQDLARPDALDAFGAADPEVDELIPPKLRQRLRGMGCLDFSRALLPMNPLGRWLMDRPTVLVVDDNLFVHGGLDAEFGLADPAVINRRVREEIFGRPDWVPVRSILDSGGPQWNREYMLRPSSEREDALQAVLERHGCRRMVVGHTPTSYLGPAAAGKVASLYGDRLQCVDTGIGRFHGANLSALRIENGVAEPVYPQA